MRIILILTILVALALLADAAKNANKKKPAAKGKGKKAVKKQNPNKKKNTPKKKPAPPPPPPPFTGCISPESELINDVLQESIQTKLEDVWGNPSSKPWLEFKVMKYCWLAEVAKIVQKYQGGLPGVEAFNYRVIKYVLIWADDMLSRASLSFFQQTQCTEARYMWQLIEKFRTQYEEKISAFVPMVINEFAVLPFGCSYTDGQVMEIDCLFLTEGFFEFLVQLAQVGGGEVKPPSLIFLAPYLQHLLAE